VHEALQLAEQQEEANRFALDNLVPYFGRVGMYRTLLDKWLPTLRKSGDKKTQASAINYSGLVNDSLGHYDTAMDYYQQSLQISLEIGDRAGEGTTLNNISQVFQAQGDYETALDYLQQVLKIMREIGDRKNEGGTLNNISLVFQAQGDYEMALDYLQQSLQISREIGDRAVEGTTLNNISQVYDAQGDYETALDYLQQSLQIQKEIGDLAGLSRTLFNMGINCWKTEKQQQAYSHWLNAYAIAKKIGHAQVLAALEDWAKQLGGDGLAFWEKLASEQE
jgi:tetratricopeptide (TPR) repeat protein